MANDNTFGLRLGQLTMLHDLAAEANLDLVTLFGPEKIIQQLCCVSQHTRRLFHSIPFRPKKSAYLEGDKLRYPSAWQDGGSIRFLVSPAMCPSCAISIVHQPLLVISFPISSLYLPFRGGIFFVTFL
jgi:hypothetical protein